MLGRLCSIILLLTTLGTLRTASVSQAQIHSTFQKRIPIAITSAMEDFPSIAFCPATGQYLVAFIKDTLITGQRLDGFGNLIGPPFAITPPSSNSGYWPVTACAGGSSPYFVVAWLREGDYFDILIQAVHGDHQAEPGSQLMGDPISTGGYYLLPSLDCSDVEPTCLLLRNNFTSNFEMIAQRLEVTESGVALLGDSFLLPNTMTTSSLGAVTWNNLDQNYLVAWQSDGAHMVFTHVHAEEQGPGMNEFQHDPVILFEPEEHRICAWPTAAFNLQTGKFLVAFTCEDVDDGSNPELILRRVDGTGTGIQGEPVHLTDLGGAPNNSLVFLDTWSINQVNGNSQFIVSVETMESETPQDQLLYLIPIIGAYDPTSPDQSSGQTILFRRSEQLMAGGASDPATGRSILAVAEYSPGPDIFGYLFAPYVYRFTQIYKN